MSKTLVKRLVMYLAGLFTMTIGIALSVKSNLGVSPVSSIPYTMTVIWGIEMGKATILFHCALVLLQILVLRKRFQPVNLLQIVVGILFGYFTTFCNWGTSFLPTPENMGFRLLLMLLSVVFIAFGIFLYMPPNIMPLAGEGAMKAVSDVSGIAFPKVKIGFDVTMVVLSLIACLTLTHSVGSVGIGTVLAAVLVGTVLNFFTKHFAASRDHWLYGDQNEAEPKSAAVPGDHYVITIAREYGSGGREIGKAIAESLGISYYDLDVIREVAQESGLSEETVGRNEQAIGSPVTEYLLNWCVQSTTEEELPLVEQIYHTQERIIREIAGRKSCVIVGRLANHILKDSVPGFHVFVRADMDSKVRQIMERDGLTESQAREKIAKVDRERANHCQYFTHEQWHDLRHYDLAIRSDLLGFQGTAEMITAAAKTELGLSDPGETT